MKFVEKGVLKAIISHLRGYLEISYMRRRNIACFIPFWMKERRQDYRVTSAVHNRNLSIFLNIRLRKQVPPAIGFPSSI